MRTIIAIMLCWSGLVSAACNYPGSLDSIPADMTRSTPVNAAGERAHWTHHNRLADCVMAIQSFIGITDDEPGSLVARIAAVEAGGGGATEWGDITGTLSDQTDLDTALDGKQPISSTLTGIAAISEPSAYVLYGWNDTANAPAAFTIGAGLSQATTALTVEIQGGTTNMTFSGSPLTLGGSLALSNGGLGGAITVPSGFNVLLGIPDGSAAAETYTLGNGLAFSGTSVVVASPLNSTTLGTGTAIDLGSDATGDIYYRDSGGDVARLAAGTDGHVLTLASGLPSWAASSGGSAWTRIEKATTETRNSDATLTNDSALSFAADAGATYLVNIVAWCSTGTTPDFKYAVTAPSGGTSFIITGWALGGGGSQVFQSTTSNATPGTSYSLTGAGGSCFLNLNLYIENGATPGTIALQWAQNASNPADTSVLKGSYIEYREL